MLGVQRLRRAGRIGCRDDLLVVDVATLLHLTGRAGALHDDDSLKTSEPAHHLIDAVLDRRDLALARGAVDGDQDLRLGELHPLAHGLGGEATEHDVVRRADARAGEHRDDHLGDHRQVDADDVAFLDALVLQRAGETFDVGQQLGVADRALGAVLAFPVQRDALTPPGDHVPIETVVGDVQRAAGEPLVERRIVVVEHARPLLKPVELLGLRDPPAQRIGGRILVDGRIVQQRLLAEGQRRLERLDVQQCRELPVEGLTGRAF